MSEREDSPAPDSAETTERRDWDVPPDAAGESSGARGERSDVPGPDPERHPAGPPVAPDVPGGDHPPDESERRDWDVP